MTRGRAVWQLEGALQVLAAGVVVCFALGASNLYPLNIPIGRDVRWPALALLAVAALLYAWREGDANMRGVWLCTRNDALGNLAVEAAAVGVFGTGTAWPDLAVAAIMAGLAIHCGSSVIGQARGELQGLAART